MPTRIAGTTLQQQCIGKNTYWAKGAAGLVICLIAAAIDVYRSCFQSNGCSQGWLKHAQEHACHSVDQQQPAHAAHKTRFTACTAEGLHFGGIWTPIEEPLTWSRDLQTADTASVSAYAKAYLVRSRGRSWICPRDDRFVYVAKMPIISTAMQEVAYRSHVVAQHDVRSAA